MAVPALMYNFMVVPSQVATTKYHVPVLRTVVEVTVVVELLLLQYSNVTVLFVFRPRPRPYS